MSDKAKEVSDKAKEVSDEGKEVPPSLPCPQNFHFKNFVICPGNESTSVLVRWRAPVLRDVRLLGSEDKQ